MKLDPEKTVMFNDDPRIQMVFGELKTFQDRLMAIDQRLEEVRAEGVRLNVERAKTLGVAEYLQAQIAAYQKAKQENPPGDGEDKNADI